MNKFVAMLEDDADDRYLTTDTLAELRISIPVRYYSNSQELFSALSNGERPSLILLDDNATPDSGINVLKRLKSGEETKDIPVVVLSESDLPAYRREAYRHGASSFIRKPASFEETKRKISAFFHYWFDVAEV